MAEQLKPCPFCGSTEIAFERGTARISTRYNCEDCGCSLETGETWHAPKVWNTRAQMTDEMSEVKLLALTCGSPGGPSTAAALARIIRICIDMGITEKMDELRAILKIAPDTPPTAKSETRAELK